MVSNLRAPFSHFAHFPGVFTLEVPRLQIPFFSPAELGRLPFFLTYQRFCVCELLCSTRRFTHILIRKWIHEWVIDRQFAWPCLLRFFALTQTCEVIHYGKIEGLIYKRAGKEVEDTTWLESTIMNTLASSGLHVLALVNLGIWWKFSIMRRSVRLCWCCP